MDAGIYIALSKQLGIFQDLTVTANNIANSDTTGYQSQTLLFSDFLTPGSQQEGTQAFADNGTTFRNTDQGDLKVTNSPLDAAIEGTGYFTVQTPLGIRYTRNGNFRLNGQGNLVTKEGYNVLDQSNQPVQFDELDRNISIRDDGTITVSGEERSTLKIVQFDNEQLLQRVGNTMYSSSTQPKPAQNYRVINGALESSNVQVFTAMSHLIEVSRSISDTANLISNIYTLERKASDTLAKIYS